MSPGGNERLPGEPFYRAEWYVERDEVSSVLRLLRDGESIVWVVGSPGSGKSALLAEVARRYDGPVVGPIQLRTYPLGASPIYSDSSESASIRQTLLLIDGWDELLASMARSEVMRDIRTISAQVVIASRPHPGPSATGRGAVVELRGPSREQVRTFLDATVSRERRRRARKVRGDPQLSTWNDLVQWARRSGLVKELPVSDVAPLDHTSLLAPDGWPLRPDDERYRLHVVRMQEVSDGLLRWLRDRPERMYELDHRKFEQVVAELLSRQGYDVNLTPATGDGGFDVRAAMDSEIGSFLYLVEAKRYAPNRPVGVGVVRHLAGVVHAQRATAGVLVTTSHYTSPAKEFQQTIPHQISLKEFNDLQDWLSKAIE